MNGLKLSSVLALLLFCLFQAAPAQAQATRTWVSGVGDDVNPCSRTAPCKTFAGAISKTAPRGEISVLDPGGFGAVTITKSISIVNDNSGEAGILAAGTNGIIVNAAATDVVILRGLVIDGGTAAVPGLNGIRFIAGGALHVEKCLIKNFSGTSPNGFGVMFAPSGASELYLSDTTLISNGNAAAVTGAGVLIQPTGSGSPTVSISNVRLENNNRGVLADSTTSTGAHKVSILNSTISGNTGFGVSAVTAPAGGVPITMMISNTSVVNNANGVVSNGSGSTIRIGGSTITGSGSAGLAIANGGTLLSYKDNQINGNTSDGTPVTAVGLN
jgi:hypothetical protein